MSKTFGVDTKIEALVIGYSITDSDGVVESTHIYETPQKFTITNSGIDHFFMYDKEVSAVYDTTSSVLSPRFGVVYNGSCAGCIGRMSLGSGVGPRSADMLELEVPNGIATTTTVDIFYADSNGACIDYIYGSGDESDSYEFTYELYGETAPTLLNTTGMYYNRATGEIAMQIAHISPVMQEDTVATEIGLGYSFLDESTLLFASALLPVAVVIPTGKCIRTLCRCRLMLDSSVHSNPQFVTGWDTTGTNRIEYYLPPTTDTYYKDEQAVTCDGFFCSAPHMLFDFVKSTGVMDLEFYTYSAFLCLDPPFADSDDDDINYCALTMYEDYSFAPLWRHVIQPSAGAGIYRAFCEYWHGFSNSSGTHSCVAPDYVVGNFYRDFVYTFGANWPDNRTVSIKAIRVRGVTYIFDTPQIKTNAQTLSLTFRFSISRM